MKKAFKEFWYDFLILGFGIYYVIASDIGEGDYENLRQLIAGVFFLLVGWMIDIKRQVRKRNEREVRIYVESKMDSSQIAALVNQVVNSERKR